MLLRQRMRDFAAPACQITSWEHSRKRARDVRGQPWTRTPKSTSTVLLPDRGPGEAVIAVLTSAVATNLSLERHRWKPLPGAAASCGHYRPHQGDPGATAPPVSASTTGGGAAHQACATGNQRG